MAALTKSPAAIRLSRELNRQAAIIGYVNAFVMYTIASTLGIALTFLVRPKAAL